MYSHPRLTYPLPHGAVVEHRYRPGVRLIVVSGPHVGITDIVYMVKTPEGKVEPAKRGNLKV